MPKTAHDASSWVMVRAPPCRRASKSIHPIGPHARKQDPHDLGRAPPRESLEQHVDCGTVMVAARPRRVVEAQPAETIDSEVGVRRRNANRPGEDRFHHAERVRPVYWAARARAS